MIHFFLRPNQGIYALNSNLSLSQKDIEKLVWLFGESELQSSSKIEGNFVGPRKEMVTPWSTNAVEITQNMGLLGIIRIEEYIPYADGSIYDPMLSSLYASLDQDIFLTDKQP